ncbi:TIGR03364 family FAD-dependent oxidoreductase [Plastoroseomonas arctica]|uniref:TIGR03364 family FAD-dependent oxidoreductase n=1 Tax=Plastoroseomonas arctica TaxID=1509237 RepID=A0AAF1KMI6_9PROT|nr:TIGR03364 family FAD-dependent oxidoreductase [Plastoroseomonas arctica]MBR0653503.1 TIGR03364 family FAD-dependent oxidoreductase [Plastoroseomonas arctica]
MPNRSPDIIIIGAGIIGLAHAYLAARAGKRVVVVERDAQANGASIRNFGFVTVTGQGAGATWERARRARNIWAEIAPLARIDVHHRGTLVAARRPEALAVLEEFSAGPMGEGCRLLRGAELPEPLRRDALAGALHSPHELRVESREAIPKLAAYLETMGVVFQWRTAVTAIAEGEVRTTGGAIAAKHIVVCPGTDITTLFGQSFAARGVTLCKLHMLRVADPGWRLPAAVMSDLGLHRYRGYHGASSLPALRARLAAEQPEALEHGVHLIVVQGADGSLVVGDSHHYSATPDPFQPGFVDDIILDELRRVLVIEPRVIERWIGVYPSGETDAFFETPLPGVRLVSVTSGTGASTGFGLAQEVLHDLMGLEYAT